MHNRKHAVVMGASMGGLLGARALSRHFEQVTLIEQDSLPTGAEQRRGVPQGRHTHGLLAGGYRVLERFFPDFGAEAVAAGAIPGDIVRDVRWFFEGAPLARPTSGMDGLLISRPLLESLVRRRVLAIPNVRIRQGHVDSLTTTADYKSVTGVRVAGDEISADLVVDATGRGSKTPRWLESLGYQRAPEERVEVALSYCTRYFRRQRAHLGGDLGTVVPPTPLGKRGGVMVAQEDHRWTVTLIGHFGNVAPEEIQGFLEYAASLPSTAIYETIRDAEPIGEPASARFPASQRRRYEKLTRFPAGFLVLGDGVCSFNPIYGQGMSVAALESEALDAVLRQSPDDLARTFFRRMGDLVDIPWMSAVGNDLRMPETVGPRSAAGNLINRYIARLHRAGHRDEELSMAFHRVANLLAPPSSLFHPGVLWRVLRGQATAAQANSSPLGRGKVPVLREGCIPPPRKT